MLDPKLIRNDLVRISSEMLHRGVQLDTDQLFLLEEKRKTLQTRLQYLQNERNVKSKAVGSAKAQGKSTEELFQQVKEINTQIETTESAFKSVQDELNAVLLMIPNLPHSTVPIGPSEESNVVVRQWGEPKKWEFTPKDHVDLGAQWGMDFETAAKLSGARFVVLKGPLARLQRALIQFMLDIHTREHGYQEVYVPTLVYSDCLIGTGQLPKFKDDQFAIAGDQGFYLIPTAEVPVTNMYREEIISSDQLPLKYVSYSSCFRSEAGSYGKDTRGMIRNHQFEKVELVQIVHPDYSYEALEELTQHAETILQKLELPYRVMALCSGDLGFSAAKTYDLEVWLPAQNKYREISSCSNTEAFQARRMKARFRDESGKTELVHTLNGSGLAVGRTLVAILENNQDELGRIHIPSALQPYMNGLAVIE